MRWKTLKNVLKHCSTQQQERAIPPLLFSQIVTDAASAASARDSHAAVRHPVGPAPTMRMDLDAAAATALDMMAVCHQRIAACQNVQATAAGRPRGTVQFSMHTVLFKKRNPEKRKNLSTAGIEPALFRTST
jgi:hypothetical protein